MTAWLSSLLRNVDVVNTAIRHNPLLVRPVRACSRRFEGADSSLRQAICQDLVRRAVRWGLQTGYGGSYGEVLQDWPILEKSRIRSSPRDFLRQWHIRIGASTGGTTGTPLTLFRSLENIASERFFIEQLLAAHNLDLHLSRVVILRADEVKDPADHNAPYGIYRNGGRTLILSNAHLNEQNLTWYANELKRFQPSVLYVYPSMLENLMTLLDRASQRISVPIVLSSSEMVNAALFEKVANQFGGRLIDYYGQGERVAFASAREKEQYRFNPVYGTVELLPAMDAVSDDEVAYFKVIATGHWNSAMPLVRYDTGDLAMVDRDSLDELEQITRGERPFLGIKGRHSEFLIGPDGEVVSGLNHLPRNVGNLIRMQVVQRSPTAVRLNVLVENAFSKSDEAQLRSNARLLFPSAMEIQVQVCSELQRQKNGKIPFVIRNSDDHA